MGTFLWHRVRESEKFINLNDKDEHQLWVAIIATQKYISSRPKMSKRKEPKKLENREKNKKRKKSLRKKLNCICVFLSHVTTLLLLYFYYHSLLDVSIGCIHYVCASASLLCECGSGCGCVCALVKLYICTLKGELCSRAFCAFLAAENWKCC